MVFFYLGEHLSARSSEQIWCFWAIIGLTPMVSSELAIPKIKGQNKQNQSRGERLRTSVDKENPNYSRDLRSVLEKDEFWARFVDKNPIGWFDSTFENPATVRLNRVPTSGKLWWFLSWWRLNGVLFGANMVFLSNNWSDSYGIFRTRYTKNKRAKPTKSITGRAFACVSW